MLRKKAKKKHGNSTRASVKKEMAKPRMSRSIRATEPGAEVVDLLDGKHELSWGAKNFAGCRQIAPLTQRGVERLFPTDVVDGPEDLRFVSCGETWGPDIAVAFVIGDV
jgi:hypothetical protein